MTISTKGRTFAIGDIHGCYDELRVLLNAIHPATNDTLIFLGDYIDRGANSKAVLDTIIDLKSQCNVIALIGNHESMMRDAFLLTNEKSRKNWALNWIRNGAESTLSSYLADISVLDFQDIDSAAIPASITNHLSFIQSMPSYYETDTHIFVHATPRPDEDIKTQCDSDLLWRRAGKTDKQFNYNHISGKTIISGHTAQESGLPISLSDKNIIIDSGCVWTGWLTAMNIGDSTYLQASKKSVRYT